MSRTAVFDWFGKFTSATTSVQEAKCLRRIAAIKTLQGRNCEPTFLCIIIYIDFINHT